MGRQARQTRGSATGAAAREYVNQEAERRLALAEAELGKGLARAQEQAEAREALAGLAESLSESRDLILSVQGRRLKPEERADAGDRAARQREQLHDHRRQLAALVLRGAVDPQQAQAAGRLLDDCVKDLQWMAERLDRAVWGDKVAIEAEVRHQHQVIDSSMLDYEQRDALRGIIQAAMAKAKPIAVQGKSGDESQGDEE